MNLDPYLITGPALISFSGGRTSGYMLNQIVQAYGGTLPPDVHVAFANTGKEREETLRYVHECGSRWGVKIHWLEWRARPLEVEGRKGFREWLDKNDPSHRMVCDGGFEEVGFNSASRRGEPFATLIAMKQRLPNWQERWCTDFLKVRTLTAFIKTLGWKPGEFTETVGLRYDEGHRILKGMANAEKFGRRMAYPLSRARARKPDVMGFWLGENTDPKNLTHPLPQGFDLGLRDYEGNCDLCFLKGRGIRKRIIRDDPSRPAWWSRQESTYKGSQERGWFDKRDSYAGLLEEVRRSPDLFDESDGEEYDVECGLHCATDIEDAA